MSNSSSFASITIALLIVVTINAAYAEKLDSNLFLGAWAGELPVAVKGSVEEPKILNGKKDSNSFVVGIVFRDEHGVNRICTGLNVSAHIVLTAKHCTCHQNKYLVSNSQNLKSVSPSPVWRLAARESQFGQRCDSLEAFPLSEGSDLAVLKLEDPLVDIGSSGCGDFGLIARIKPEAYWASHYPSAVSASGYGDDPASGSKEQRLHANISLNDLSCRRLRDPSIACVAYREMVMGATPIGGIRFDSCRGDSGGPAFVEEGGSLVPLSVVSRALPTQPDGECGGGGIYTHLGLSDVVGWLNRNIHVDRQHCEN